MAQKGNDEIDCHIKEAAARLKDTVVSEEAKRKELKENLTAFHNAINQRETALRKNIDKNYQDDMDNLTSQAEKLEQAINVGDTNHLKDLLKQMGGK